MPNRPVKQQPEYTTLSIQRRTRKLLEVLRKRMVKKTERAVSLDECVRVAVRRLLGKTRQRAKVS